MEYSDYKHIQKLDDEQLEEEIKLLDGIEREEIMLTKLIDGVENRYASGTSKFLPMKTKTHRPKSEVVDSRS